MAEKYYRVEQKNYASVDYDGDFVSGTTTRLVEQEFDVVRTTRCGVWLDIYGERKFVLNRGKKRFAYKTEAEALEAFIHRKKRQISILGNQLRDAKYALFLAETQRAPMVLTNNEPRT